MTSSHRNTFREKSLRRWSGLVMRPNRDEERLYTSNIVRITVKLVKF